jgi:hypothetical protein
MDPMDPRIIGWWTIIDWTAINDDKEADQFPDNGFIRSGPLLIVEAEKGYSLFWPDEKQGLCSLHYPVDPQTRVTFAGHSFPCLITDRTLVELDPRDPRALKLTVTLTTGSKTGSGRDKRSTGNTGTFVAQAPPGGW